MPNYNSTLQTNNSSLEEIITQLNNMPDAGGEQATPVISVNNSNGLITATAGTKSSTYQLAFQAAQTITPGTTNKTIPANTYLGGVQTIKGDANLVASNIVSGKSIFGVVGTASAGSGSGSGDTSIEDGLVTRTLTTYTNDRVTSIGSYAFQYCSSLTTVSFPAVITIGEAAFRYCDNLTTISFPVATSIGDYAFNNCHRLTTASFSAATSICYGAFEDCYNLTTISFPVATSIGLSAFAYCSRLTTASFPVATTIDNSAFACCSCLTTVSFPAATIISRYAFYSCTSLTTVSFPNATNINSSAFQYCYNLTKIYLMNSSVCTLVNSNAFSTTGITSTTGSIFVPSSLVTAYKSATNWTYFSNRIYGA